MSSLFALGSNGSGQLGIGHEEDVNVATKSVLLGVNDNFTIRQIAAGGNHTLVLLGDGHLFSSGSTKLGQCFEEKGCNNATVHEFHQVTLSNGSGKEPAEFLLCAATWEASFGVLQDGRLICAGAGNRGELGLGQEMRFTDATEIHASFPPSGTSIVDLAAGMNHIVALLSNGDVYGWGAGRKGQLGHLKEDSWTPRIINIPFRARRVVVGNNFTYVVGDPQTGDHIFIGLDKWSVVPSLPTKLSPWKNIAASWGSIYVLLESGELLSWGRDDHFQLCPPDIPGITNIAAGSEHIVCVTDDGQVLSWGWGEHGNCGPNVEEPAFDSKRSELIVPGNVTFVGAGCATSWIGVVGAG